MSPSAKKSNITAQGFGLFCSIVNESAVNQIRPGESKTAFCKRISDTYKIEVDHTKARQFIGSSAELKSSDKHLKEVVSNILPTLDIATKEMLMSYITQQATNNYKKMYA